MEHNLHPASSSTCSQKKFRVHKKHKMDQFSACGATATIPQFGTMPMTLAPRHFTPRHFLALSFLMLLAFVAPNSAAPVANNDESSSVEEKVFVLKVHSDLFPYRLQFPKSAPYTPTVEVRNIGEDHLNATWLPASYNPSDPRPTGTRGYFKFRERGESTWSEAMPLGGNLTVQLAGLEPGTEYELVAVAVTDLGGDEPQQMQTESAPVFVKTDGIARAGLSWWWLIILLLLIILLIIILCVACVVAKARGQKYPVGEKEREAGREPMLDNEEKQFPEYNKDSAEHAASTGGDTAERASLAPSQAVSEADSMADYGDGNGLGRFTEDGSWIGAYVPNRQLVASIPTPESSARGPVPPPRSGKASTTLV